MSSTKPKKLDGQLNREKLILIEGSMRKSNDETNQVITETEVAEVLAVRGY